ncbi:MAG: L-2-hydroxyglutarate oxidase [Gemmatimonadetes bacterium]|nr:L-2-hydroxyglutarate oxidase [Gemmatimonadota bacterium]
MRILVIGGGLVGLGAARALRARFPRAALTLVDKEPAFGAHQSTHNSGVLHSGLYYKPGSARARLVRRGLAQITEYCAAKGIVHDICGKLVVAATEDEIPRLQALFERGQQNGLKGLRWLSAAEAREIEPHVRVVAAVHVPEEGIVDYRGVVDALAADLRADGAELMASAPATRIIRDGAGWRVFIGGAAERELSADFIVTCGGLHSDRLATLAGERPATRIVGFRGEYFVIKPEREHLVKGLIYPVPDPQFPFLGVHFTRLARGGVECGPNAVLALDREGYRRWAFNARDAASALAFPGLWRFVSRYVRTTVYELKRSLSKEVFVQSLQRLVPDITADDIAPGPVGVRAQAMRPDGSLVDDFDFLERPGALHVLNAPSPAATACLAIGEEIAARVVV